MEQNAAQLGVITEIMIKIKPEPQQRTDLKVYENKISLLDQYDRAIDEFITNGAILESSDAIRNTFESTVGKYIGFVVHGVNLTLFTFGAKSSGKTFSLQGNQNESGILGLLVETLFGNLESKHAGIVEEMQRLNAPEAEMTTFSYSVRMKYVELRDEGIIDLLQKYNYYKQPCQLIYSEHEGYTINGAAWVSLPNSMAFPDLLAEGEKYKAPYEYNKVTKNSTVLTIEVTQQLDNKTTKDVKVITSRINIFDLPSADILNEHFRNLSNSMEYRGIYAFQNMLGELAKTNNNAMPSVYENSILTKLMKEYIGGNSLTMGIFTLQNNNFTISEITFKMMKLCSRIQNYPILNDVNAMGLLRKFRTDISYYNRFKGPNPGYDMRPPIINPSQNENTFQQSSPLIPNQSDINALQARNNFLEKENQRLDDLLKNSDIEKADLLQSIANMQNRVPQNVNPNFNPVNQMGAMPPFMGDKYDVSDKLLHIEDDINETNQIMGVVNKLNERFKVLEQERKDLAEEVERLRQDNTNLTNEINKIQNDANTNKTNADNELFSLKEMLNSTKNELDYMRSEAEKYRKIQADLLVEIDEREVQYKKQLEDKEREIEMKMIDQQQNEKRRLESEMREATRKLEHYGGENKDLNETIKKLREEIRKLKLKLQEMQSSFRDYLNNQNEDNEDEESGSSAKAKLMKTFTDRENQLMEDLGVQKAENENLREKLKKMRTYARKARNIALDYYPPNEELPEMLTKDLEAFFQDAENESVIQFLEFEIRSLRERNKKLEYENNRLKTEYNINSNIQPPNYGVTNNKLSQTMGNKPYSSVIAPPNVPVNQDINNLSEREIQKKILEEISKLKNTPQGGIVDNNNNNIINSQQIQELNKLRSDNMKLNEENKRLKTIINDNTVNDIQKTNEPDNPKAMKMKINFLEKTIEQLEKERSELNMRCTMAEEQLKNFQEMFNTTTQGYQKKILELNKRLEAANLRLNQEYLNSNMD
jgi:hypothetical protein